MSLENSTAPATANDAAPLIWSIGGGKGGVGKSVVTSSLAVALARAGKKCVVLDADLGGANLHTLFGIANPQSSLSEFFQRQTSSLEEILLPTSIPNLQLISGARPLLDMANPLHAQKQKILRQLMTLKVDYILLDLGAGSSFNVLDFFLTGSGQFVVVAPFPTSVENAYHFLKAAFFRKLKKAAQDLGIFNRVDLVLRERQTLGIRTPKEMLDFLRKHHPGKGPELVEGMQAFCPQIIVNQVRREEENDLGLQMAQAASEYFGLEVGCLGYLRNDDRVHHAVQMKRPVLEMFPQSGFSVAIKDFIRQILGPVEMNHEQ